MQQVATLEKPLWEAAKDAFDTMIMLPIEQAEESDCQFGDEQTVVGSITFTGVLRGALIIKCPSEIASLIAKSMLMMSPEEEIESSEVHDAFGEVVNLALGGFKSRIAGEIGNIDISVPMVMEGKDVTPSTGVDGHKTVIYAKGDTCKLKFILICKKPA